jgi:flavorubredoxin
MGKGNEPRAAWQDRPSRIAAPRLGRPHIADVRKGMQGLKGKPYALFCSHGGGSRVREVMVSLFRRVGTQVGPPMASRGRPSPQVLEQCRVLGKALGESVAQG